MDSKDDLSGAFDMRRFCEHYNISRANAWKQIGPDGELRARRLGGKIYISKADARAWFEGLPEDLGGRRRAGSY